MSSASPKGEARQQQKLGVRYDEFVARYANQVMLRSTPEEVFLEFSSGVVQDPVTGQPLMPVHTRIAMTHTGARRLAELLSQTLSRPQIVQGETQAQTGEGASGSAPAKK